MWPCDEVPERYSVYGRVRGERGRQEERERDTQKITREKRKRKKQVATENEEQEERKRKRDVDTAIREGGTLSLTLLNLSPLRFTI